MRKTKTEAFLCESKAKAEGRPQSRTTERLDVSHEVVVHVPRGQRDGVVRGVKLGAEARVFVHSDCHRVARHRSTEHHGVRGALRGVAGVEVRPGLWCHPVGAIFAIFIPDQVP